MSSPISPLTDQIDRMRQMGGNAVQMIGHPMQALHHLMSPAPPPQDTSWHDGMVRQANQTHVDARGPGVLQQHSGADFRNDIPNDQFQYGPANRQHMQNDTNRAFSGVQGYPSDQDYMKNANDAQLETQQNRMKLPTFPDPMKQQGVLTQAAKRPRQ